MVHDRSQESGVRSQESGVRSQESGVRSQESGVGSRESGGRRQEAGGRRQDGRCLRILCGNGTQSLNRLLEVRQGEPKARKTSSVQADNESVLGSEREREFSENEGTKRECL